MNLEFRIIKMEKRSPYIIAAMDHAIFEECEASRSPSTLVFHNWEPSVSLANGQALSDINLRECAKQGFGVVRLTTGGKAVVHFPDTEFSYSLFVPVDGINPRKTYEEYCGRIANALQSLGIPSAVVDNNDIFVGERKIGGNAQHVKREYAMQQGIVLYETPSAKRMLSLMHPSLYNSGAEERLHSLLTSVRAHSSASQEQVRQIMVEYLLNGDFHTKGYLSEREQQRIRELEPSYRRTKEVQAPQIRGLCWLPASAYHQAKVEARA